MTTTKKTAPADVAASREGLPNSVGGTVSTTTVTSDRIQDGFATTMRPEFAAAHAVDRITTPLEYVDRRAEGASDTYWIVADEAIPSPGIRWFWAFSADRWPLRGIQAEEKLRQPGYTWHWADPKPEDSKYTTIGLYRLVGISGQSATFERAVR